MTLLFLLRLLALFALSSVTVSACVVYPTYEGPVVGIDLGATYSRVAVQRNETVELIATVASRDSVQRLYGQPQSADEAQLVHESTTGILRQLKEAAEAYLNESVSHAVVTVPRNSTDAQHNAIHEAGASANLQVISLVRKPAAAIWAHGYAQDPERMVLLYDIGSTRTSVSIVLVDDDARVDDMRVFEWLADASLPMGGRDFDRRIADHLMAVYEEKTGVDIAAHPSALKDLVHEAEAAKRRLSSDDSTEVFFQWPEDGRTFSEILTRTKFESLVSDLIDQTTELVERTLKDTQAWATEDARGLRKEEVHDIILAGGSSNIPLIQQRLTELFDKPPRLDVAPEEVVVHGAAVLGRTAKGRGERTHDEL